MKGSEVLFSKESTNWLTPLDLFAEIQHAFRISLDPCATKDHELFVDRNFYEDDNGLVQDWNCNTFVNPPYDNIELWVNKALEQHNKHTMSTYVLLLPSRTDRPWFQRLVTNAKAICFIRKRLRFSGAKNNAPFPSLIAVLSYDISTKQKDMLKKLGATIWNRN